MYAFKFYFLNMQVEVVLPMELSRSRTVCDPNAWSQPKDDGEMQPHTSKEEDRHSRLARPSGLT